jgi:CRISPR/Cas system CMR subunit Cmr4 (Cas7 group RAMP superfamily)
MKELEKTAVKDLVEVYQLFISKGLIKEVINKARFAYNEYIPANTLLRDMIISAVVWLFSIAYPNVNSGINPPTKEEARKMLEKLKKLQKELEQ